VCACASVWCVIKYNNYIMETTTLEMMLLSTERKINQDGISNENKRKNNNKTFAVDDVLRMNDLGDGGVDARHGGRGEGSDRERERKKMTRKNLIAIGDDVNGDDHENGEEEKLDLYEDVETDSELDEELEGDERKRNAWSNAETTKLGAASDTDDDKTITAKELVVRRKENVEKLMGLYERTYYDLIETMRKRHRKFHLKRGHVGLKDAATALMKARAGKSENNNITNSVANQKQDDDGARGGDKRNDSFDGDDEAAMINTTCSSDDCVKHAMPLSRFCLQHIALDMNQRFYEFDEKTGKMQRRISEKFPTPKEEQYNNNNNNNNNNEEGEGEEEMKILMFPNGPNTTSPGGADLSLAASLGLL
jgi:hypothetical protein